MRTPRHLQVRSDTAQRFHATSRCVRRAYLCGEDHYTGVSYEHRKAWVEERLIALSKLYAVAVYAYAVMSNHLHVLFTVDPTAVAAWSDDEVARRWLSLTTARRLDEQAFEDRVNQVLTRPKRLAELRHRLGSVSWFMGNLKEYIARRANKEDNCKGHFWEARFDLTDTLDDDALLSQMVYIDLNPVRAGISNSPEQGPHTSALRRINTHIPGATLTPVAGSIRAALPDITEAQYLDLLRWTAQALHGTKPPETPRPPLACLTLPQNAWLQQVAGTETHFRRAIGSPDALTQRAAQLGQRWLVGIGFARGLAKTHKTAPTIPP